MEIHTYPGKSMHSHKYAQVSMDILGYLPISPTKVGYEVWGREGKGKARRGKGKRKRRARTFGIELHKLTRPRSRTHERNETK